MKGKLDWKDGELEDDVKSQANSEMGQSQLSVGSKESQNSVKTTLKKIQRKKSASALVQRPFVRTLFIIISVMCFLDAGLALYLATEVNTSLFWKIGADYFNFNLKNGIFLLLVLSGVSSAVLLISGVALVRNPEALFRWVGTILSFFQFLVLITLGASQTLQTIVFKKELREYCSGNIVDMSMVAKSFIYEVENADKIFLQDLMCSSSCPCSTKIQDLSDEFGSRSTELKQLVFDKEGKVEKFFDDCYLPLVEQGRQFNLMSEPLI